jgi:hypothetical protein
MGVETPTLNGRRLSGLSIRAKFDGQTFTGFSALNYKQSLKSQKVTGNTVIAEGRTGGEYEASGDFEMILEHANILRAALAAKDPNGSYGFVEFDIEAFFEEDVAAHHVVLRKCRWEEEDNAYKRGTDGATEKVTLSVMWIEKDGLRLYNPTTVAA